MATIDLGKIKLVNRGAYNNSTAYTVDDLVQSGGTTYICIQNSTGNAVTNTSYWNVLAQKGTDGTDLTSTLTTQGDILYRDGSGLARLAAGTSGQVLQTGGSGANPSWTNVSSDYVKIASGTHSGNDLIFDNFDWSTYKMFKVHLDGMYGGSGQYLAGRFRYDNSGTQTTYTGSSYRYAIGGRHTGTSTGNTGETSGTGNQDKLRLNWSLSDNAVDTQDIMITIQDWNNTTHFKSMYIEVYGNYANGSNDYTMFLDGICQLRSSGTAYNGLVLFKHDGGSWTAKNYAIYGIK